MVSGDRNAKAPAAIDILTDCRRVPGTFIGEHPSQGEPTVQIAKVPQTTTQCKITKHGDGSLLHDEQWNVLRIREVTMSLRSPTIGLVYVICLLSVSVAHSETLLISPNPTTMSTEVRANDREVMGTSVISNAEKSVSPEPQRIELSGGRVTVVIPSDKEEYWPRCGLGHPIKKILFHSFARLRHGAP